MTIKTKKPIIHLDMVGNTINTPCGLPIFRGNGKVRKQLAFMPEKVTCKNCLRWIYGGK